MCQGCLFALGGIRVLKCQAFYVQFKVDMIIDNLIKVDKKTQSLLVDILERDYVNGKTQEVSNGANKKKNKKNDRSKGTIDPFDSDSD